MTPTELLHYIQKKFPDVRFHNPYGGPANTGSIPVLDYQKIATVEIIGKHLMFHRTNAWVGIVDNYNTTLIEKIRDCVTRDADDTWITAIDDGPWANPTNVIFSFVCTEEDPFYPPSPRTVEVFRGVRLIE